MPRTEVIGEPSCGALPNPQRTKFEGRFPMGMFWLSIVVGILGFAGIMFAISHDDA